MSAWDTLRRLIRTSRASERADRIVIGEYVQRRVYEKTGQWVPANLYEAPMSDEECDEIQRALIWTQDGAAS